MVTSIEPERSSAMMDKDGGWPAVVNRNLVVILFLLRCRAVGEAAQMALITCHSYLPMIPVHDAIDKERKKEKGMARVLKVSTYLP